MEFSAEDTSTWLRLVRDVIATFAGGFPAYVERDELEQECLIKIPSIITKYAARNGAALETFVRTSVRNDIRDYLKGKHRENGGPAPVPLEKGGLDDGEDDTPANPLEKRAAIDYFRQARGERHETKEVWILATVPDESITDDDLSAAKLALTADQYRVYVCRLLLGMTQQETADYLHTTREAIASRQRKMVGNLERAGLPVPNRVA